MVLIVKSSPRVCSYVEALAIIGQGLFVFLAKVAALCAVFVLAVLACNGGKL